MAKGTDNKYASRSLLDELGIKPAASVALIGVTDQDFLEQLAARTRDIASSRPIKPPF